jgi:hypothetical protein
VSRRAPSSRLAGIIIALLIGVSGLDAHQVDQLRINAGIELFPSFIAADLDIADKTDRDGNLLLLLVHQANKHLAVHLAAALAKVERIRDRLIRVRIVSVEALTDYPDPRPAGIFIAEHLTDEALDTVLAYGQEAGVLVISPHMGDVEYGVSGGISVSDRILPYVNMRALDAGGIRLKPFFLRITQKYGE